MDLSLVKECLSIASSSTAKDNEIQMLINAAELDMERQGINLDGDNNLIKGCIVMYVKANFGMCSIEEKNLALACYKNICSNLSLSQSYREEE